MKVYAYLDKGILAYMNFAIPISCVVRNETNNRRKNEVVYSMPDRKPIQPRPFPKGVWNIGTPRERTDPYLAPYFIPTDAFQMLPVWELDSLGNYKRATKELVKDTGYGLHFSTSSTTIGCIKVLDKQELLNFVSYLNNLPKKEERLLIVV